MESLDKEDYGRAIRSRGRGSRSRWLLGGLPLRENGVEHTTYRQAGVPQGQDLWRRPDAARRFGDSTDGAGRLARRAAPRHVYGILYVYAQSLPAPKRSPFLTRSPGLCRKARRDGRQASRTGDLRWRAVP